MSISIVVLAHNQLASTKRCLNSLFKYTSEPYSLILIDNGSIDNTQEYFLNVKKTADRKIKIITYEKNEGFIVPNNCAIKSVDDDILILNNDIEFTTHRWLTQLTDALSAKNVGLSYPLNRTRGIKYYGGLIKNSKESLLNYDVDKDEPTWAQFSCVLIKRKAIREVGLLDERFSPGYFEDVDYSLRLKEAGYELKLVPEVIVEHYQSVTTKTLNLDKFRYSNRAKFYKKWGTKV